MFGTEKINKKKKGRWK